MSGGCWCHCHMSILKFGPILSIAFPSAADTAIFEQAVADRDEALKYAMPVKNINQCETHCNTYRLVMSDCTPELSDCFLAK